MGKFWGTKGHSVTSVVAFAGYLWCDQSLKFAFAAKLAAHLPS